MATNVMSRAPSTASQKLPLPHVSTLWQSAELPTSRSNRSTEASTTLISQRNSKQRSPTSSPKHKSLDLRNTPNIHLLTDFGPEEFQPSYHRRRDSSEMYSPESTRQGSIFELPSNTNDSPNSSILSCSTAELEDTSALNGSSLNPLPNQPTAPTESSVLFTPNKITPHAILKAVDETIAGIEAANRELLARTEAAEASAYRLHVSNTELRNRVEELSMHHRPKPAPAMKPVSTQTSPRNSPPHTPDARIDRSGSHVLLDHASSSRPQANFSTAQIRGPPTFHNESRVETPIESGNDDSKRKSCRSMRSLRFLPRFQAEGFSVYYPNTSTNNLNPAPSSERPKTADATSYPSRPSVPPVPDLPIFLALSSHAVQSGKQHSRNISLEEAKKLATTAHRRDVKYMLPLSKKPLGEMSPSPVYGVVEIGLGIQEGDEKVGPGGGQQAKPLKSQLSRARLLLKDKVLRELLESGSWDKEKKKKSQREGNKWRETIAWAENAAADVGERRKMSAFWKRGKKGDGAVPVA